MRGRSKHILSLCLLLLYLSFQAGVSVFSHVHILNGEKLVHSHPYSNANHNHTADQAVTIARLSSFQTLEALTVSIEEVELPVLYALEYSADRFCTKAPQIRCISLRAPPFC